MNLETNIVGILEPGWEDYITPLGVSRNFLEVELRHAKLVTRERWNDIEERQTAPRLMPAKWGGNCVRCNSLITKGEMFYWLPLEGMVCESCQ